MALDDTMTTLTKEQESEFRLHPHRIHHEQYRVKLRDGTEEMKFCGRFLELVTIGEVAFFTCKEHGHIAWRDTVMYRE